MKVVRLNDQEQKQVAKPEESKSLFTVYPNSVSTIKCYIKKLESEISALKQSNNEFQRKAIILKNSQITLLNEMRIIKAQLKNLQENQTHLKTL